MASVMSTDQGEAGLFPHVVIFRCDDVIVISVLQCRVSLSETQGGPSLPVEVTRGQMEVVELLAWDKRNGNM